LEFIKSEFHQYGVFPYLRVTQIPFCEYWLVVIQSYIPFLQPVS